VFDIDTEEQLSNISRLKVLDGYQLNSNEEDAFGFWLIDESEESPLHDAGISGGYLTIELDNASKQLKVFVEYNLTQTLNDEQIESLIEYTIGQCLDGIGNTVDEEIAEKFGLATSLINERDNTSFRCY
jgi:hypothetical protein